jgi:PAS domain S-box-containing protein
MKKAKKAVDKTELRKRAEKEFEIKDSNTIGASGMTPEKTADLIHELQVHQIELKMQNDELRRIQDYLENTRDKYTHLYDFAPIGYFTVDENRLIDEANLTFASLLGVVRSDLVGKPFNRFVLKEDQDIFYKHRQILLETQTPQSCELRLVGKGGHAFFVRLEAIIIQNTNNVDQVRVSASDITESKKTEKMLKENEKKYRTLFKASSDAIFLVNMDTFKLIDANEKAIQLYGYDYAELLTMKPMDLSAEPEKTKSAILKAEKGMVPVRYHKKKDGTIFPVEITANIFKLNDQRINISTIRDISEIKKIEQQLIQSQKMEAIGTLAGGIAHDFNNILSSIIGFTELALGEVEKDTEIEDDLQEVRIAGLRAKDLVKQILTFARQSDEVVKPIQVNIIAKEVLKFIKPSIPTIIKIKNKIYSDSFIMGSSTQVHQILMNLCTNAAHAMEESGGILELSVNDSTINRMDFPDLKPGEYVEIKVTDTGMGISPQHIQTIFEPYFTTKAVGGGTGMGLAVVQGIVENYGGQIAVDSKIGKGTCFTIYLPLSQKRKAHTHFEKEDLPIGNGNILFVDDEAPIAKMGSKILEQLGYCVTTRTSSVEALELFKSKPQAFDLVVSDMTMPNMTGDKMATEMMNIRSDIPVILCTGYSKKISEESATDIGIKALVYKPVVKADLAKTVRKVLDESNRSK